MNANWIELREEAEKLPLGHIGKLYAAEVQRLEYKQCHTRANKFKFKTHTLELPDALKLLSNLLYEFGETGSVKVKLKSTDVHRFAGAHYNAKTRTIHFPFAHINTRTLLHEFSHHLHRVNNFPGSTHGDEFCDIQDMVFTSALKRIK